MNTHTQMILQFLRNLRSVIIDRGIIWYTAKCPQRNYNILKSSTITLWWSKINKWNQSRKIFCVLPLHLLNSFSQDQNTSSVSNYVYTVFVNTETELSSPLLVNYYFFFYLIHSSKRERVKKTPKSDLYISCSRGTRKTRVHPPSPRSIGTTFSFSVWPK